MVNKSFPKDQHPIQVELRGLARAARRISRRRLRQLAAGAAATTLLAGLNAAPALADTIVIGCPPDQVCTPDLSALIDEGQTAESLSLNFTKIATQYKDQAVKLEQDIRLYLCCTTDKSGPHFEFLKLLQGSHKLEDQALFLKIGALKLNGDGMKLADDAFKLENAVTDGTSHLSDKALFLKVQQLEALGFKIDGLEATLSNDADALQSDYLKLVDEFQELTGTPIETIG